MADATAPLKKERLPKPQEQVVETNEEKDGEKEAAALAQKFNPDKKYMFELAEENPVRELPVMGVRNNRSTPEPHKRFNPYRNIVLTSQIVWNGQRRNLRYYDGCTTIFQDEQPKDKDAMDQLIKQTRRREFLEGKFGCFGDERMLLLYLTICSWNVESQFRTRTANEIFRPSNPDRVANAKSAKMDAIEKAMELAREATKTKMLIHANYLGVPEVDYESGNPLTDKEIRTFYREAAANDPVKFIESYGNKNIELKYFIDKALADGTISNTFNPNKATWKGSNTVICDVSGLKSHAAIAEKLFEFASLEDGEEFKIQLKALFS